MEETMKGATVIKVYSAAIYLGISILAAALFILVTLAGDYTWVDRIGGAFWLFILLTIALMPVVIPAVKKRMEKTV